MDNYLKRVDYALVMKGVIACWLLIQIVLICIFIGHPQGSDQGEYLRIAQVCFDRGEWYPSAEHIHDDYIWAPGFINYLILQLKVFGTLQLNMILNLVMQIGILWLIFRLGERFFNRQTARLAVILWCLLYSNWLIVAPAGTEIPFLFLVLSALYLTLFHRLWFFLVAGVLLGVANWIRPVMVIFLLTIFIGMIWEKKNWKYYVVGLTSLLLTVGLIGKTVEKRTGYFVYQSTTGGVNLIMTSNDDAYGGVASSVIGNPNNIAYIPNKDKLTFFEKDSIWKARSVEWIKQNPGRAAWLYAKKIGGLYVEDSWPDRPIMGGDGIFDSYVVAGKASQAEFLRQVTLRVLKSAVYYVILILFIYTLFRWRKEVFTFPRLILLFLLVMGTGMTCVLAISPRFHYPFLFVIVLFAAFGIERELKKYSLPKID